jgi:hypothetical protein
LTQRSLISRTFPCLAAILLGAGAELPAQHFVRGDVNLDGEVSHFDVTLMVMAGLIQHQPTRCLKAADIDDDGLVDLSGPDEAILLGNWLFRPERGSHLPAPFLAKGLDPTPDGRGLGFSWQGPPDLEPGQRNVQFFLLATTGNPILSFAASFRIDSRIFENVRVDLDQTIVPAAAGKLLMLSPFFQSRVTPAATKGFDLLRIAVVYALPGDGQGLALRGIRERWAPLAFAATEGPIADAPLLRVRVDVRAEAPVGRFARVISQAPDEDFVVAARAVHGLVTEFASIEEDGVGRMPGTSEDLPPTVIGGAEEFLRGDANADGTVNIADATTLLGFLFLGDDPLACEDAADANDDGSLNISDASFALGYLFLGTAQPPFPGPANCGPDALTADPIRCWAGCPH